MYIMLILGLITIKLKLINKKIIKNKLKRKSLMNKLLICLLSNKKEI